MYTTLPLTTFSYPPFCHEPDMMPCVAQHSLFFCSSPFQNLGRPLHPRKHLSGLTISSFCLSMAARAGLVEGAGCDERKELHARRRVCSVFRDQELALYTLTSVSRNDRTVILRYLWDAVSTKLRTGQRPNLLLHVELRNEDGRDSQILGCTRALEYQGIIGWQV